MNVLGVLRQRRHIGEIINSLGILFNIASIILNLILFLQTSNGQCSYVFSFATVLHVVNVGLYVCDIWKPLRISYRCCMQSTIYIMVSILNLYHFIWIMVGLKTQNDRCDSMTMLVSEIILSMINFTWINVSTIISGCHYCNVTEGSEVEGELVGIAVRQSLEQTVQEINQEANQLTENLFNCLITVEPPTECLVPGSITPAVTGAYKTVKEMRICRHRFHAKCIMQWLLKYGQNSCPVCRSVILQQLPISEQSPRAKAEDHQCAICYDLLWIKS